MSEKRNYIDSNLIQRPASKVLDYFGDENKFDEFLGQSIDDAFAEFEQQGVTPDEMMVENRATELMQNHIKQFQGLYEKEADRLKQATLQGGAQSIQDIPELNPNYSRDKRAKSEGAILREAVAQEKDPNELLRMMDDPSSIDLPKYAIDPYEYGQPEILAPPEGRGIGRQVLEGTLNVLTAPERFAVAGKNVEIEKTLGGASDITLQELQDLRKQRQEKLAKAQEQRESRKKGFFGMGSYGPGTSLTNMQDDYDNAPIHINDLGLDSGRVFGGSEGIQHDIPESLKAGGSAMFTKGFRDPESNLDKSASMMREHYLDQGINLAIEELGEGATEEQIEAKAIENAQLLIASDRGSRFIQSPEAIQALYGFATDPALGAVGGLASKGMKAGVRGAKGAMRGTARNLAQPKELRRPALDAIQEGIGSQGVIDDINEEIGVAFGRAKSAGDAYEKTLQEAADLASRELPRGIDPELLYRHIRGIEMPVEVSDDVMNVLEQLKQKYIPLVDQNYKVAQQADAVKRRNDEWGFIEEGYQEGYVPALVQKTPETVDELVLERAKNVQRKVSSSSGLEMERKIADDALVQDVGVQLNAAIKRQKAKVAKKAFMGDTYRALKKKGLVMSSDDLGVSIGTTSKRSEVQAAKEEITAALVKDNPGVDFVFLPDGLAKEWTIAGSKVGDEVAEMPIVAVPRELWDAAKHLDAPDQTGFMKAVAREVAGPLTQSFKSVVLGAYALKYAGLQAVGNMGMGYVSRGLSIVDNLDTAAQVTAHKMKSDMYKIFGKNAKDLDIYKAPLSLPSGNSISVGEAVEYAQKYNLVSQSEARQGAQALKLGNFKTANPLKQVENVTGIMAKPAFAGAKFFDETHRLNVFMSLIQDNTDDALRQAAKDTLEITGNFNRMAPVERDFLRHTVAFWNWQKFSAEWFTKNIVANPQRFAQFNRFVDYYNANIDPDKPLSYETIPEWAEGRMSAMKIPGAPMDEEGRQLFVTPEIPMGIAQNLTGSVTDVYSPLAHAVLMFMTGYDTRNGKPIPGGAGELDSLTAPFLDLRKSIDGSSQAWKNIYNILLRSNKDMAAAWAATPMTQQAQMLRALGIPAYATSGENRRFFQDLDTRKGLKGVGSEARYDRILGLDNE